MKGRGIISLLIILGLMAGGISSLLQASGRTRHALAQALQTAEGREKVPAAISAPDRHPAVDTPLLTLSHTLLPVPVALFGIMLAIVAASGSIERIRLQLSGSSPPFMAFHGRHTYLRIAILRI